MKKMTKILLTAFAVLVLSIVGVIKTNAQTASNHLFHVNTQYSITGLDSVARAERNAILKEYHDKVTMKNEFILHTWTMGHFFSEDSREFVTIYEVAS
jgi:hypothetical protein